MNLARKRKIARNSYIALPIAMIACNLWKVASLLIIPVIAAFAAFVVFVIWVFFSTF